MFRSSVSLPHHARAALGASLAAALAVAGLTFASSPAHAAPSITFTDPGALSSGQVTLTGTVAGGPAKTTTVLYAVDSSQSTDKPVGLDCDGNGAKGQGSAGVAGGDNQNGDSSIGDVLDCQIGAVAALNSSLIGSTNTFVSLEKFSKTAAPVDLDPSTPEIDAFKAPGDKGSGADPLVVTAARTLRRGNTSENPQGTDFNVAATQAISILSKAPAGLKTVVFLSDGKAENQDGKVTQDTLRMLAASGIRLRAFLVSDTDVCAGSGLDQMAKATGETCTSIKSPAGLAGTLATEQPPGVSAVQVTVGGNVFPAAVNLAGDWSVSLGIGAGSYLATATVTATDGSTASVSRTLTVADSGNGVAPGTVSGTQATRTAVVVRRPKATLAKLPAKVHGWVGKARAGHSPQKVAALQNAVVLLRGRSSPSAAWVNLGSARVKANGHFVITRRAHAGIRHLRVVLLPYKQFGKSHHKVPRPTISRCVIHTNASAFSGTCRAAAKGGTSVRLLRAGRVVQQSTVRHHRVHFSGTGKAALYVLHVGRHHVRL